MALRFCDSFDHSAIADAGMKYDSVFGALTTGRFAKRLHATNIYDLI